MTIIGVPGRMRTIRSLLILVARFAPAFDEIVVITDEDQPFAPDQREELEQAGLSLRISDDLVAELPEADIVYTNSILWIGEDYEELGQKFRLDASSPLKPGAIILHPLARGRELSRELDQTTHNWYFAQARGAVFIRMALLSTILRTFA
jgi:aspartate carbamoyltransferase catalytic subunit